MVEEQGLVKNTEQKFFSREFHTHFFPALFWSRVRRKESGGTTFVPLEWYLVIAFCLVLAAIGIPSALNHHSIIAWIAGGIGVAGILILTVSSICSRQGSPSYEEFLWGVFFFLSCSALARGYLPVPSNNRLFLVWREVSRDFYWDVCSEFSPASGFNISVCWQYY